MKLVYSLLFLIVFIACNSKKQISPRINHVVVQVSDLKESIKFYTSAFDLEVTNDRLKHVVYTLADGTKQEKDINLVLLKFPGQDFVFEMSQVGTVKDSVNFDLFHHVGIDVKDIDKAFEKAVRAGAKVVVPVRLVQTNGIEAKQAFLKGPDGENIELMQIISGEF